MRISSALKNFTLYLCLSLVCLQISVAETEDKEGNNQNLLSPATIRESINRKSNYKCVHSQTECYFKRHLTHLKNLLNKVPENNYLSSRRDCFKDKVFYERLQRSQLLNDLESILRSKLYDFNKTFPVLSSEFKLLTVPIKSGRFKDFRNQFKRYQNSINPSFILRNRKRRNDECIQSAKDANESDAILLMTYEASNKRETSRKFLESIIDNSTYQKTNEDSTSVTQNTSIDYGSVKSLDVESSTDNVQTTCMEIYDNSACIPPLKETGNKRSITLLLVSMVCPQVRNKIKQYIPWLASTTVSPPISELLLPSQNLRICAKCKGKAKNKFGWCKLS